MLVVSDLNGWYGESHVLHGVSFDLQEGEVITLLGRNGAGKSSTLRAIMGLLKKRSGSILFNGEEIIGRSPIRQMASRSQPCCASARISVGWKSANGSATFQLAA